MVQSFTISSPTIELFGMMYCVVKMSETPKRIERALRLTTTCLKMNPANYTTWHFRRSCLAAITAEQRIAARITEQKDAKLLESLGFDGTTSENSGANTTNTNANTIPKLLVKYDAKLVETDLEMAANLGGPNPKNYQVWYHRRALMEPFLQSLSTETYILPHDLTRATTLINSELGYIQSVLTVDAKNYHAWSNRQWLLRTASQLFQSQQKEKLHRSLWEEEREYANTLISTDLRNNSAWNHLWFVAHRGGGSGGSTSTPLSIKSANTEALFALEACKLDKWNESPWRYLVGIGKELVRNAKNSNFQSVADVDKVNYIIEELGDEINTLKVTDPKVAQVGCAFLTSARLDFLVMENTSESLLQAANLAQFLAEKEDRMRAKYWHKRKKELMMKVTEDTTL